MMRILKIPLIVIFMFLSSTCVLAQTEPSPSTPVKSIETSFSIGFSLNLPTDVRLSARDIGGIEGFAVRADLGGFYAIISGYLQAALNLEYHFAAVGQDGLYFGLGLTVYKDVLGMPNNNSFLDQWRSGIQAYIGLELGISFFELGVVRFLESDNGGVNRITFGFNLYF
jgi:hypothetical protein